jgi:predicted Rossmann fold flavoprotein
LKIAIIGAGAAGCFAAANLELGTTDTVVLFEKSGKALQKVKVSGGGRCNVTNASTDIKELLDKYPRGRALLQRTLHQFGTQDTRRWFEERGLPLKAEADGRVFPVSDDSQSVIDCIWQSMMRNKVQVYYNKSLQRIERTVAQYVLHFADGANYVADKVLITTGGHAKAEAYDYLRDLGHHIIAPIPSLFTFNIPNNTVTELMGVSVPFAGIKIAGTKIQQSGPLLITHWGMSGPAVLRLSAYAAIELHECKYDFKILVNWLGHKTEIEVKDECTQLRREQGKQFVWSSKAFELPKRLWEYITHKCGISEQVRWGDLSASAQNKLCEYLTRDSYLVKGKTTFKEEFVNCGGIDINEVDKLTMESKKAAGIYFAGEVLHVDGITGGFNFQHAWSSAFVAAKHIVL